MAVRQKYILALVARLLKSHGIKTAPVPIEKVARALGADLHWQPAEDELSGFYIRDLKRRRAVIGVNSNHHANRQRFTIAHELGHFLMHEGEKLHVDHNDLGYQVKLRNDESRKGVDPEEKEANLFAAELLMPSQFLAKDLLTLGGVDLLEDNVLSELAEKYGVSTQALTFRLANLGYIRL